MSTLDPMLADAIRDAPALAVVFMMVGGVVGFWLRGVVEAPLINALRSIRRDQVNEIIERNREK